MVKQSGFAGGEVAKQFPDLQQGTDYDFFVMPGIQGLQGSVEPMMAFADTPAVQALVAYFPPHRAAPIGRPRPSDFPRIRAQLEITPTRRSRSWVRRCHNTGFHDRHR